jgi:hypothetical protein
MSNTPNLTTFLDSLGRTIIGELVSDKSTKTHLAVQNPVIVHIVPAGNSGQMTVQLLPVFFREFLADKTEDTVWFYNKQSITESDTLVFDFKLTAQYQQMFSKSNLIIPPDAGQVSPATTSQAQDVVKLFDE